MDESSIIEKRRRLVTLIVNASENDLLPPYVEKINAIKILDNKTNKNEINLFNFVMNEDSKTPFREVSADDQVLHQDAEHLLHQDAEHLLLHRAHDLINKFETSDYSNKQGKRKELDDDLSKIKEQLQDFLPEYKELKSIDMNGNNYKIENVEKQTIGKRFTSMFGLK
ncbi:MAG: hypothetical protein CMF80_06700 [Candidatus Marinimicrobia bacterium]|nr:hypothetical protein [Candidatus Neomarinimicrobiota bacterium]|tara:strand:+ start:1773 stop:2276 length:504 start_codon:yes stop_codon:yes gene_type:complete